MAKPEFIAAVREDRGLERWAMGDWTTRESKERECGLESAARERFGNWRRDVNESRERLLGKELSILRAQERSEQSSTEKEKIRSEKAGAEKKRETGAVNGGYLKAVFLQFFSQEASKRESLIRVLLAIVDCSEEEVQLALREWNESQQGVSVSFWPFSVCEEYWSRWNDDMLAETALPEHEGKQVWVRIQV
jgi:hypothetical protein